MNVDDLHTYLFAGEPHALAPQMRSWLASSRRFITFVAAVRSKIRKKLRAVQTPESVADLLLELETAYLLLQERSLGIVYEPQVPGRPRCPDFAVTFTTHSTFMLEVTRLRAQPETPVQDQVSASAVPSHPPPFPFKPERLGDTIGSKLGQLLPQRSNVLLIGSPTPVLTQDDLRAVMTHLQGRAERGDASLLKRSRFRDRGDFFHHYRRLSEVLVCGLPRRAGDPLVAWVNPQAKHPLPSKVRTALYRSQAA